MDLHRKYGITPYMTILNVGPMVRIAPKEVLIADPEALKVIYALRSGFTKVPPVTTHLKRVVSLLYSLQQLLQVRSLQHYRRKLTCLETPQCQCLLQRRIDRQNGTNHEPRK